MNCSRRLYKGNTYEICLPLNVSGVTSMTVNFYTDGEIIVEKDLEDFDISGGTMCVTLDDDDLDYLNDGVLRYEVIYETEDGNSGDYSTNTPYVVVTPAGYTGTTFEEAIQDAYDSGYTQGYEDGAASGMSGYASGYTDGYADGYASGTTDGYDSGYTSGTTDGYADGYASGVTDGYGSGYTQGYMDAITLCGNYELQYFTIEALENGVIPNVSSGMMYSVNAGPWVVADGNPISLSSGDIVRFKRVAYRTNEDFKGIAMQCKVYGNVMSLLYGDNYVNKTSFPGDEGYEFYNLFSGSTGFNNAENIVLPATALDNSCYGYMFFHCTSLVTAPELPATTLSPDCYKLMFYDTNLTTAPELPATTLSSRCYDYMFGKCANLVEAPELPATILSGCALCYDGMFANCTSLVQAPELPATVLDKSCYAGMFMGCTSLTTAPELPATILYSWCYESMFRGCSSLTTAPELPATTLTNYCYAFMFAHCSRLTTAPDLPAETLADYCYREMFSGCTSLNYIQCLAVDTNYTYPTYNWVAGVSQTGTFVKEYGMTDWTSGTNGIPYGWTVREATVPYRQQYFTIEALESGGIDLLRNNGDFRPLYIRVNNGNWTYYGNWDEISFSVDEGDIIEFKGDNSSYEGIHFGGDFEFNVYGNIYSLVDSDDFEFAQELNVWNMFNSFMDHTLVVDASNLVFPSRYAGNSTLAFFFDGCTILEAAPELRMTNVSDYAFQYMFRGCTSLTTAPELLAGWCGDYAYLGMFSGCSSLNYIKCDLVDPTTAKTQDWVYGVANWGTFIFFEGAEWTSGVSGIPTQWTASEYDFDSVPSRAVLPLSGGSITILIRCLHNWTVTSVPSGVSVNRNSAMAGEVNLRVTTTASESTRIFGNILLTDDVTGKVLAIPVIQSEMSVIWEDDFPDGSEMGYTDPYDPDFMEEFYSYPDVTTYLDWYLSDMDSNGCNKYVLIGDMTFEGDDYWLYQHIDPETGKPLDGSDTVAYALVAKSRDEAEIKAHSLDEDYDNLYEGYEAFDYFLDTDGEAYGVSSSMPYIIVKVE